MPQFLHTDAEKQRRNDSLKMANAIFTNSSSQISLARQKYGLLIKFLYAFFNLVGKFSPVVKVLVQELIH